MNFVAQLATAVEPSEEADLITSDAHYLQPKYDGRRLMIHKVNGVCRFYNREGTPTTPPPTRFVRALDVLPGEILLDSEYIHELKIVFLDLLQLQSVDAREAEYKTRHDILWKLCQEVGLPPELEVVETAVTLKQKIGLIKRLQAQHAEGLIVRDKEGKYRPGRPSHGGPVRKIKWKSRGDFIVQRTTDDTESFICLCFDGEGQVVDVGKVNARVLDEHGDRFWEQLKPGQAAVAEIEYLYASDDRRLVQTKLIRFRSDKKPQECTIDQVIRTIGGRFRKPLHVVRPSQSLLRRRA
jgi:ATP-dependent DNA ligase